MNKKLGSTLIAMTIIIFMLFLTLGMFTGKLGGSASAEVAAPHASIVGGTLSNVDTDNNQNSMEVGNKGEYTFSVKNTDKDNGDKVSEVAMKYKLYVDTVTTDNDNNSIYDGTVNYELWETDENGNEQKQITTTETDEEKKEWYTDDDMKFTVETDSAKQVQVHYYKLKFTPDSSGEFNFKVKVKTEQVD